MKLLSSVMRVLLLVTLGLLPSLGFAADTDSSGNALQTAPSQDQKINPTPSAHNETNTESTTGKVTFQIYYGHPYEYAPFYHSYYTPYDCCYHYKAAK